MRHIFIPFFFMACINRARIKIAFVNRLQLEYLHSTRHVLTPCHAPLAHAGTSESYSRPAALSRLWTTPQTVRAGATLASTRLGDGFPRISSQTERGGGHAAQYRAYFDHPHWEFATACGTRADDGRPRSTGGAGAPWLHESGPSRGGRCGSAPSRRGDRCAHRWRDE